jgi:hypothetical protein
VRTKLNAEGAVRLIASRLRRRHYLLMHPQTAMTDPPESRTAVDHYEAALEASCDALITLQLIHASATSSLAEIEDVEGQITRAIKTLQRATAELRLARTERRNKLISGFVVETYTGDSGGVASVLAQSKPRRTA